jgi:hypothetical protein
MEGVHEVNMSRSNILGSATLNVPIVPHLITALTEAS